jgi:hypothetical protein
MLSIKLPSDPRMESVMRALLRFSMRTDDLDALAAYIYIADADLRLEQLTAGPLASVVAAALDDLNRTPAGRTARTG